MPLIQPSAPTIRDVARFTGVSAQTVSRVLNNPESVKGPTRERVLAGIERLEYRRSPLARGLATKRSGAIGILDSGSAVMGQMLLLSLVETAVRSSGFSPRVVTMAASGRAPLATGFEALRDEFVEGIIVLGNTTLDVERAVSAASWAPIVLLGSVSMSGSELSTVAVDQAQGARDLIIHLRSRGPRLAHISGPRGWVDADARLAAWWSEAPQPEGRYLHEGDWSARSGYQAMNLLLDEGIDSVFAANDYMALGALRACQDRRVCVPEDVAIGGFDDVAGADYFQPSLTTVRPPLAALGRTSVDLISELIEGKPARHVLLPAELVVRDSG